MTGENRALLSAPSEEAEVVSRDHLQVEAGVLGA
jgi:hypothetical protein